MKDREPGFAVGQKVLIWLNHRAKGRPGGWKGKWYLAQVHKIRGKTVDVRRIKENMDLWPVIENVKWPRIRPLLVIEGLNISHRDYNPIFPPHWQRQEPSYSITVSGPSHIPFRDLSVKYEQLGWYRQDGLPSVDLNPFALFPGDCRQTYLDRFVELGLLTKEQAEWIQGEKESGHDCCCCQGDDHEIQEG